LSGSTFIEHPGGSLINDRAINANFQERVLGGNEVRTFRTSLNTLGDGFVECIDSNTLVAIQNGQPGSMKGTFIQVPVLESGGALRGGRFGWKNQHASLVSFSADAYLNEMGITSPLQPTDNNSNGSAVVNGVPVDDGVSDPEDDGEDIETFARFMRATKAPPRDDVLAATSDAQAGSVLFDQVGCAVCHVRNITTAPAGDGDQPGRVHRAGGPGQQDHPSRSAISCCTTWAPATASSRTAGSPRARWSARRRCGGCAAVTGSCTTETR
jgi:mono/diheme cytochrome c family protein